MLTTHSDINNLLSSSSTLNSVDDNNEEDEEAMFSHHKRSKRRIVSSASSSPELKPAYVKGRKKTSNNPNRKDKAGRTKLFYATTAGHLDKVKELIGQGAIVNFKDNAGWTPLHEAALKGQFEIGKYLIECGADVNVRGFGDDTPLHDASCNGYVEFVRLLVDAGADVFALNDEKQRPIDVCEDAECVDILENKMKKLDRLIAKDKQGRSLLHRAIMDHKQNKAHMLLEQGADVNAKDNQDYTPLHWACIHGHLDLVELLIEHGAVVNISSQLYTTPLHEASRHGHEDIVRYLLNHTQVDVNAENKEGKNAYHLAAHYPTIRQLLTARMDEVRLEKEASKALDEIASRTASINESERQLTREERKIQGYMRVFANLEDKKEDMPVRKKRRQRKKSVSVESEEKKEIRLDPFKKDTSGRTLLYRYIVKGSVDTVEKLLENGANPNEKDHAGWSPIHEAALRGKTDILRILLKYGGDVNIVGADKDTPLHDATENNHTEVVELLLQNGADPFCRNANNCEPMDIAIEHHYDDILCLLQSYTQKKKIEVDDIKKTPKKRRLIQAANLEKIKTDNTIPTKITDTKRDPHSPIPTPPPEYYLKEKEDASKYTPLYTVQSNGIVYLIDLQVSMFLGIDTDIFWRRYGHIHKISVGKEQKERLWHSLRSMVEEDRTVFMERTLFFIPLESIFSLIKHDYHYLENSFITLPLDIKLHSYSGLPPKIAMKMKKCGYRFQQHS